MKLRFYSIWESGYRWGTMTSLLKEAGFESVNSPEDAHILVFNGGADIGTSIYNELPVFRGIPANQGNRDRDEIQLYERFVGSKFMMGICRGAQLLNCLNGGKLWQHVDNHQVDHQMLDLLTGKVIKVTSTHHQMMKPNLDLGQVIGIANRSYVKMSEGIDNKKYHLPMNLEDGKDIEVVWYPNTRSLCIQGHPEYVPGTEFATWSIDLMVSKYNATNTCKVAI
jgi:gamma-glutamyl-gamma-aminobutyrate hydrolase PuuD